MQGSKLVFVFIIPPCQPVSLADDRAGLLREKKQDNKNNPSRLPEIIRTEFPITFCFSSNRDDDASS